MTDQITQAHTQTETLHIITSVPDHQPRENDPHYKIFNETKARMEKQGLMKCWISNSECAGDLELHHDKIEFCLANDVDITEFAKIFPEFTGKTDEEFQEWIEGPGNLLCLCRMHHIGVLGIHSLPYPLWEPQQYLKAGIAAPAKLITDISATITQNNA